MRVLQLVASEGKRLDGPNGICYLQAGTELDVFITDTNMHETSQGGEINRRGQGSLAEQTTVILIELRHRGDLPEGFAQQVANRAYDFAAAKGVMMVDAEPRYVSGLPVKEMAK